MKLSNNAKGHYKYDVALSFAGEDRWYVEVVAHELKNNKVKIFYDWDQKVDLWGKYLPDHLHDVYSNEALFCVIFVSEDYLKKIWTNVERRSALSRSIRQTEEYILPAQLDDSKIIGLEDLVYIDLRKFTSYEFAELIISKLKAANYNNLQERLKDYVPKSKKFNYFLDYNELSILEGFDDSRFRYRAITKIAQEFGEEKEIIKERLLSLKDKGLINIINRPKGQKWAITNEGKDYLHYYYHELDEESSG